MKELISIHILAGCGITAVHHHNVDVAYPQPSIDEQTGGILIEKITIGLFTVSVLTGYVCISVSPVDGEPITQKTTMSRIAEFQKKILFVAKREGVFLIYKICT